MKLLLWDVDLTLIKTGGAGIRGLARAFEDVFGWKGAMDQVRPQGKTDPAIIREVCVRHGVDQDDDVASAVDAVLDRYVGHLEDEVRSTEGYEILPGVLAMLETVSRLDAVISGLATGNVEQGARIKLQRGALNDYFPFGGFGRVSERRVDVVREAHRRAVEWTGHVFRAEETFVIGDTPQDVAAGKEAGFRTVAVATGSASAEQLQATGPDLVIADLAVGRRQFLRSTRIE